MLDHFYRHELYNQKYASIGIPRVPISDLPYYQRLRPYQKKYVQMELKKKFSVKQCQNFYELWELVAKFIACAYSKR